MYPFFVKYINHHSKKKRYYYKTTNSCILGHFPGGIIPGILQAETKLLGEAKPKLPSLILDQLSALYNIDTGFIIVCNIFHFRHFRYLVYVYEKSTNVVVFSNNKCTNIYPLIT